MFERRSAPFKRAFPSRFGWQIVPGGKPNTACGTHALPARYAALKLQFDKIPGLQCVHRACNQRQLLLDFWPACRWKNQNCQPPSGKVLLIPEVPVSRDKRLKRFFGFRQQISIFQPFPSHFKRGAYLVWNQCFPQWCRSALVKENLHDGLRAD